MTFYSGPISASHTLCRATNAQHAINWSCNFSICEIYTERDAAMAFINYKGGRFRFAAAVMKFLSNASQLCSLKRQLVRAPGIARRKEKRPRDQISGAASTKNIG